MSDGLTGHLEKLRYFVAIAESGSFAKAAKVLRISQPSLSHSIRVLESVTKVKLFRRASKGVELTPAGENLYEFGKEMLEKASRTEHALPFSEGTELGSLMVATKEPYAISLWPKYLKYIEAILPNLEISLRISRMNTELIAQLEGEKYDLIMIPEPPQKEGLISYELFKDRFHFYLSPEVELEAITGKLPIYLFKRALCQGGNTVERVIREYGKGEAVLKDVDSFNVAKSFALRGLGIALLTESFVEEEVLQGKLKPIELSFISSSRFGSLSVCLTVLEKFNENKKIKKLRFLIKEFHRVRRKGNA